jgi:hypothetical protein
LGWKSIKDKGENRKKKELGEKRRGRTKKFFYKIDETSVVCGVGPRVNPLQNRGNSTYENCFVRFEIYSVKSTRLVWLVPLV